MAGDGAGRNDLGARPGEEAGPAELLRLAVVATRYYLEGRSKVEIAEELGISRFKVARMLEEAVERGVLTFQIEVPDAINPELSTQLAGAYGLRRALVVDSADEPVEKLRGDLGRVAAQLVSEVVQPGDIVGIAWGRTLNAMTAELRRLPPCTIVQLTGAISGADVDDNAIELVRRMAQLARGPAHAIYAPLLLDDADTARALRQQARVADALGWYERVTVAIVPIGSWRPPQSGLYDNLTPEERDDLFARDIRADTSTVMLTGAGEVLQTPLTERMIGIDGAQLRAIPEVIAVAGGADKAEAVTAALAAGFITTLITNSTVARALLESAASDAALA